MHKARIATLAAGAGVLAAAAIAAAAPAAVSGASARLAAAKPARTQPWPVVKPGVVRLPMTSRTGPISTAQCESSLHIACYTPNQIRLAYQTGPLYTKGITGKGATIAIVDSFGSPTIKTDLAVFDKQFGYPAPPSFKIIAPVGKITSEDPGWAAETTLDVEYAHALAPGANILLVETPVSETEGVTGFPQIVAAEKYAMNHYPVDVISQSFSATEETFNGGLATINKDHLRDAYQLAFKNKVTVLAASGDSGAADVMTNEVTYYTKPVTSWPDSDPLVTAVGGTQLQLSGGKFTSVAWNDTYNKPTNKYFTGTAGPSPFASGGGKSVFFTTPPYQQKIPKILGGRRGVPDISMSASCNGAVNVYSSFAGAPKGWSLICGTSEATPEFAGIVALADQVKGKSLGLINSTLYKLSANHAPGIVDVTSGNNTVSFFQGAGNKLITIHGFNAVQGYDMVTGVGTINAVLFVPELAAG